MTTAGDRVPSRRHQRATSCSSMSSRTHQTHAVTGIGQINLNVDAHATVDYASLPVTNPESLKAELGL